jgi:hypothetical protein
MSLDGKEDDIVAEIRSLEKEVLKSLSNVNSLAPIVKHLRVRPNLILCTSNHAKNDPKICFLFE